jgi:hypothetical protein
MYVTASRSILILSSYLSISVLNGPLPSGCLTKILHAFLISPSECIHTLIILNAITPIIFVGEGNGKIVMKSKLELLRKETNGPGLLQGTQQDNENPLIWQQVSGPKFEPE